MAWDTHERPGISEARPGLAGFHQELGQGGSAGARQDGRNGVEDIQREHGRLK